MTLYQAASPLPRREPGRPAAPVHVFSGEWLLNRSHGGSVDGCDCHPYREGYAGTRAGTWNGWAVFTVTRPVMHAVISACQQTTAAEIAAAVAGGARREEAWLDTLRHVPSVFWLGELVVVDSRGTYQDPTIVEIAAPDICGRYRVGFGWTWERVRPAHVHTVHTGQTGT